MSHLHYLNQMVSMTSNSYAADFFRWQASVTERVELHPFASLGLDIKPSWLKRHCKPKQCYANAARIALNVYDVEYVEGVMMYMGQIPIQHAWNVYDGKHFDVTQEVINGVPFANLNENWKLIQLAAPELEDLVHDISRYDTLTQHYYNKLHRIK